MGCFRVGIFSGILLFAPFRDDRRGMFASASSLAELSRMRLSIVSPLRGLKKWLFVVGVGGGREWEGELRVGGMCFRINPLRAMLSST